MKKNKIRQYNVYMVRQMPTFTGEREQKFNNKLEITKQMWRIEIKYFTQTHIIFLSPNETQNFT